MSRLRSLASRRLIFALLAILLICSLIWYLIIAPASGARLGNRTLQVGSNQINATTDYQLSFDIVSPGTLGSIVAQFCANDPLPTSPCTPPTGMDISNANLVSQSGTSGFNISNTSTANNVLLTRTASLTPLTTISFHFDNVVNPSTSGSYYVRVFTYPTEDGTGPNSDYGGIAYNITDMVAVTAEVPPYLVFCTAIRIPGQDCATTIGDYIDFGELSSKKASFGSSQMLVATNAEQGYAISVGGTTLTSGNNIISPLSSGDVSRPGVAQFGFNLRANSSPSVGNNVSGPGTSTPKPEYNVVNSYRFINNDTLVSTTGPDDVRKYTSSYIVNVPASQPAGIYVSTVTYVCLANF